MSKRIDLTNKNFGHWTVISFDKEKVIATGLIGFVNVFVEQ